MPAAWPHRKQIGRNCGRPLGCAGAPPCVGFVCSAQQWGARISRSLTIMVAAGRRKRRAAFRAALEGAGETLWRGQRAVSKVLVARIKCSPRPALAKQTRTHPPAAHSPRRPLARGRPAELSSGGK